MKEFKIRLPNEKVKAYNRISIIVLAINLLAFGLLFFKQNTLPAYIAALCMMFIISGALFTFISKNIRLQNKLTVISIALAAVSWIIIGDYMLGVLMGAVAAVSYSTLQPPFVVVGEHGLHYPSFPKQFFTWDTLNKVLLKDDVLTIDKKDNKLLQFTLPNVNMTQEEQKVFNAYCAGKVGKVSPKEVKEIGE